MIKIEPEKWKEKEYGAEGEIFGRKVIYYNDIEEGFNISAYKIYGEIEEYWCNQSDLNHTVVALMDRIKANST